MSKQVILKKTRDYVRKTLAKEATGHDWYHIERVVRNALIIGRREKADLFVVELAALLHDIGDYGKHHGSDLGSKLTVSWLRELKVEQEIIAQVNYIVQNISFRGGTNIHRMETIEGKVVQDADRLDALGAIGIARAFAFGGSRGRPVYDPKIPPSRNKTAAKSYQGTTINHFYDKILWLSDLMNTKTGYLLAKKRDKFVRDYLKQFYKEWEGRAK